MKLRAAVILKTDAEMRGAAERACPEAEFLWDARPTENSITMIGIARRSRNAM